jgi:hypothetical protein
VFLLFFGIGFIAVNNANPRNFEIYCIFIMELIVIIISFVFVLRAPKSADNSESKNQNLAKISEEKDEII